MKLNWNPITLEEEINLFKKTANELAVKYNSFDIECSPRLYEYFVNNPEICENFWIDRLSGSSITVGVSKEEIDKHNKER